MSKRISIIVPCYNTGEIIEETFISLENQTCRDFELILVNDGSTDATLQRIEAFQERTSLDVVIIDKENGGVSSARNRGIEEASCEYLLFLDSDDIYNRDFVRLMLEAIESTGADSAYCRVVRNLETSRGACFEGEVVIHTQKEAMDKLLFEMGKYGLCIYIYRKSILQENNIRFDIDTKYGEDREFNWKYLCHCERLVWIDAPLYGYRINPNSAVHKVSWRKTDVLTAMKRVAQYMENMHCPYRSMFDYMYARAMWSVAKDFAVTKDRVLFARLRKEYDVQACMKQTVKASNKKVSFASRCYLIHPTLFYWIITLAPWLLRKSTM